MGNAPPFAFEEAFTRNYGLIDKQEQQRLARCRVAIAGCGGVGGVHATTLARLGVGKFRLCDPDTFSLANFNRQVGATTATLNKNKAATIAQMITLINPQAEIEIFSGLVNQENARDFVTDAQIVVDGVDFFAMAGRRALFSAAWEANIPALTAAPLGFSATLHIFTQAGMSFDQYFDFHDDQDYYNQVVNFIIGLAPKALHLPYMDLSAVDPESGRGPSSIIGVQMAACLTAAAIVKLVLNRDAVDVAPYFLQMDAYRQTHKKNCLKYGNRGWWQQIKRFLVKKQFKKLGLDVGLKKMSTTI